MKRYRPSKLTMQEDHDHWLRKRGVHPEQLAKKYKASTSIPSYKTQRAAPTSDFVGKIVYRKQLTQEERDAVTAKYTIGQAYNKGGLVVLSEREAKDTATGKRRV